MEEENKINNELIKFSMSISSQRKFPKIGVNVLLFKDNLILLGLRKRSGKVGKWCPPGGHLHWQESIIDCAKREVLEETGLQMKKIRVGPYTNDRLTKDGKHYISLFIIAEFKSGKLINGEPYDIKEWKWFKIDELPSELFSNIDNLFKAYTLTELRRYSSFKTVKTF